jgi:hypothetical protein
MVVYIKYSIGHNIVVFHLQYGLHKWLPCKRSEAHGNEITYLDKQYLLKNATYNLYLMPHVYSVFQSASRNTAL